MANVISEKDRIRLRDTLADLYNGEDAKRIARDAGMDSVALTLSGNAYNIWEEITIKVQGSDELVPLIRAALKSFQTNAVLNEVLGAVQALPAGPLPISDGQDVPRRSPRQDLVFVGREERLAEIKRYLLVDKTSVGICGMGGWEKLLSPEKPSIRLKVILTGAAMSITRLATRTHLKWSA